MENLKDEKGEFCHIVLLVARHRDADREAGLLFIETSASVNKLN